MNSVSNEQSAQGRRHSPKRLGLVAGFMLAPILLGASDCQTENHPSKTFGNGPAAQAVHSSEGAAVAQLPAGGTHCATNGNMFSHDYKCGSGVTVSYEIGFGKGHYHVDDGDHRVAADDVAFPVYEKVAVDGMCLIISQPNEDTHVGIALYPSC